MASIINDPNGRKRIEFNGIHGGRFGIRLGKAKLHDAASFKSRIEYLTSVRIQGSSPDAETCRWLAGLPKKILAKLGKAGLVDGFEAIDIHLGPFIKAYIAERTDAKERTIINLNRSLHFLAAFFGEQMDMRKITESDADDFSRYLTRAKPLKPSDLPGAGLGLNTARRICGRSKQFFAVAIKKRLMTENPFASVKCRVQASKDRDFFITREMAFRVLAACPDAEWQLIFALSRFGGLRCPSEHLALKWADVHWKENRFIVRSPKTEHHEGKDHRIVPIFPELRRYLEAVRAKAKPDAKYVITGYRSSNVNLRKRLFSIIDLAGFKPWPKLFHNLRASRQTELAGEFPIHVVCEWLGNSALIAKKHYLQVIENHFQKAVGNIDVTMTQQKIEPAENSGKTDVINTSKSVNITKPIPPKILEILKKSPLLAQKGTPPPGV